MADGDRDKTFKLQCLTAMFANQVEYLRFLGNIDLRIFTGYIMLQLILAGWLSKFASAISAAKFGILLIDLSLSVVGAFLLVMNNKRRSEALKTFKNVIDAMGFLEPGEYIDKKPLFAGKRAPSSLPWYLTSIVISTIGVSIVLFTV
jgi:hypothetical protein